MEQEVVRFRKPARILHWLCSGSFVALFITGLILFVPALGFLAQDSWARIFHRIASVIFMATPLIYLVTNWKATLKGLKEVFTWGRHDVGWLKAAPRYYFLCDEKAMPPQEHMNTGQKLWALMVVVFGVIFVLTGVIMWFAKLAAPAVLLQWCTIIHDASFIATGVMLFVHVYLSVLHPLMGPRRTGAWSAMARGKVSAEYAKSHHAKWYERVSKEQREKTIGEERANSQQTQ